MLKSEPLVDQLHNLDVRQIAEHTVEVVADSGEGAQRAGTAFALCSAQMGNGVWTDELIPAEIQPPARTAGSLSGNRIRFGSHKITNPGDNTNTIIAFNEIALEVRMDAGILAPDACVFLDNKWLDEPDQQTRQSYRRITHRCREMGYTLYEIPLEAETLKVTDQPRRGKNMVALGVLAYFYRRNTGLMKAIIAKQFKSKGQTVVDNNLALFDLGYELGMQTLSYQYEVPATPHECSQVVMNGNQALALGAIAAGFKLCSMYPITPASSQSHYLARMFAGYGGIVHQAEDEIAAIGVALGAAYGGQPAYTITSGPGMALKTEFQALAVATETPLVIIDVQRGGPSTGLPTKVEQGDLLSSIYGTPGDAPKVVIAPSTIEECYHVMKTARQIAERLRTLVIVLSDANLATGVQPFDKPDEPDEPPANPLDLRPVSAGFLPYAWDGETGLAPRVIPGQPGGAHTVTGLAHDEKSQVSYDPDNNQRLHEMRSRKLRTLQRTLRPPAVFGEDRGELLLVGWGSTRGAIEEAVERARQRGWRVSSLHLRFLYPLEPGLKEIMSRFKQVVCVEINYSDPSDLTCEGRRLSQLATHLRSFTLLDIDSYSAVRGRPLKPGDILHMIGQRLGQPDSREQDLEFGDFEIG
ncbi:MAG: 2-oxoacid:acceptor oxidoreductase subunit alpha [Anaerolineae bacterium]